MDERINSKHSLTHTYEKRYVKDTINKRRKERMRKEKISRIRRTNMVYHFWIFGLWIRNVYGSLWQAQALLSFSCVNTNELPTIKRSMCGCCVAHTPCFRRNWCLWLSNDAYTHIQFTFLYFSHCLRKSIIYRLFQIELTWSCSAALPFAVWLRAVPPPSTSTTTTTSSTSNFVCCLVIVS